MTTHIDMCMKTFGNKLPYWSKLKQFIWWGLGVGRLQNSQKYLTMLLKHKIMLTKVIQLRFADEYDKLERTTGITMRELERNC